MCTNLNQVKARCIKGKARGSHRVCPEKLSQARTRRFRQSFPEQQRGGSDVHSVDYWSAVVIRARGRGNSSFSSSSGFISENSSWHEGADAWRRARDFCEARRNRPHFAFDSRDGKKKKIIDGWISARCEKTCYLSKRIFNFAVVWIIQMDAKVFIFIFFFTFLEARNSILAL